MRTNASSREETECRESDGSITRTDVARLNISCDLSGVLFLAVRSRGDLVCRSRMARWERLKIKRVLTRAGLLESVCARVDSTVDYSPSHCPGPFVGDG